VNIYHITGIQAQLKLLICGGRLAVLRTGLAPLPEAICISRVNSDILAWDFLD